MRALALVTVLGAVVATAFVSGCIDCTRGPPVTARDIGPGTDDAAGLFGSTLTIRVTDEPGGPPLADAGVVVYWARDRPAEWRGETVTISDGESTITVPVGEARATPEPKDALRLRTNGNGEAYANVPANRVVGVVAAADGWTEEWIPALATPDESDADVLVVPLYRARLNATLEDAWPLGDASTGFATGNNYAWRPERFPFGGTEEAARGYAERVAALTVRVTWENGLNGGGDLGIGLGPTPGEATFIADSNVNAAPGSQSETLTLDAERLAGQGLLASDLHVGAATDSAVVGLTALPYRLEVEAAFDTALARFAECATPVHDDEGLPVGASTRGIPAAGLVGAVAAFALAAFVAARVRPR